MATENDDRKSKKEKFRGFENWPQWADLTNEARLEEREVWDVVNGLRPEPTTAPQTRKKEKNNAVASKMIKQGVSTDLYINTIRKKNPPEVVGYPPPRLLASQARSCLLHT